MPQTQESQRNTGRIKREQISKKKKKKAGILRHFQTAEVKLYLKISEKFNKKETVFKKKRPILFHWKIISNT